MKKKFWNVGIEIYGDGTVNAAVLRSREAEFQPSAVYRKKPGLEVFSLWYETEDAAQGAVSEARAMNKKQEAVA
jgi:hypothetical protein